MIGTPPAQRAARSRELLQLIGLDPDQFSQRYPRQLSGGEQQRVGVARALAADPPVLLMDEPFGAIDPIARGRLQDEFLALQARLRKTIVMVTHDIDEALRLGDRIAIFAEGARLAQFATPLEILSRPADDFVRSFIGAGAEVRRLSLIEVGTLVNDHLVPQGETLQRPVEVDAATTVHTAMERALQAKADGVRLIVEGRAVDVSLQSLLAGAGRVS